MHLKPQKRSSKCSIVNRTVSFNVEDPYQRKLLEQSYNLVNFSAVVKRWIAGAVNTPVIRTEPVIIEPADPASNLVHELVPDFDPVSSLF
jgi:hypothetical protein